MTAGPHVSVVIPAYNEAARIARTLDRVCTYLHGREGPRRFEVIVVDDGSQDETASVVTERSLRTPEARLIRMPSNRGKGAAVRTGMLASSGDLVLFSDADLSTPIEEIEAAAARLNAGAEVVIGSRALAESRIIVRQNLLRMAMGKMFNRIVRLAFDVGFSDTQCGFKLFHARSAHDIFERSRIDGFAFDVEIILIARTLGYRVEEIPVRWVNEPNSRVSLAGDPLRMLVDLWRLWRHGGRWRTGPEPQTMPGSPPGPGAPSALTRREPRR